MLCQGKLSDKDQEIKLLTNKAVELNVETAPQVIKKFTQTPKNSAYGFTALGNGKNNSEPSGYQSSEPAAILPSRHLIFKNGNLYINLNGEASALMLEKLKAAFLKNSGDKKVFFRLPSGSGTRLVETDLKVEYNNVLIKTLDNILK